MPEHSRQMKMPRFEDAHCGLCAPQSKHFCRQHPFAAERSQPTRRGWTELLNFRSSRSPRQEYLKHRETDVAASTCGEFEGGRTLHLRSRHLSGGDEQTNALKRDRRPSSFLLYIVLQYRRRPPCAKPFFRKRFRF
jgi:hypothetical protein